MASSDPSTTDLFQPSLAPWLSVRDAASAVEFYKSGFRAKEVFRLEGPENSVIARLSVEGAEFWVSDESPDHGNFSPVSLNGMSVRMILIVQDPDAAFAQAIRAGATEVYPVSEGRGWRVGRLVDPFGHHWEIGRPIVK